MQMLGRGGRAGPDHGVLGVLGARGGVGASVLAAAVARRYARSGSAAVVDLSRAGGGLDVLLGIEQVPGLRWPDLVDARGAVDGAALTARLPRWGRCVVLSVDHACPGPPPPEVERDVLTALATSTRCTVLDLDRAQVLADPAVLELCRAVVLVVPRDVSGVAAALALRPTLAGAVRDLRLVVRGPAPGGMGVAEVGQAVGLMPCAALGTDAGVRAAVERGVGPVSRRGPLARVVDAVVVDGGSR
ncbi:septum site-determining protein Ssd [Cellulomonas hominis]